MRYDCDDPVFEGDFVEFSDSWSRAQTREIWKADTEEATLDILRPKVIALRLTCADTDPITAPNDLIPERTDEIDARLYRWFTATWVKHLSELADQGNALSRQLFATLDAPKAKTTRKTKPQPTGQLQHRKR